MKTKLLAICLILATLFCITSCGAKPKLDFEKAKDNLEDKDYYVEFTDDEDDLQFNMVALFAAENDDGEYLAMVEYKDLKSAKIAYKQLKLERETELEEFELQKKQYKNLLKKYDADLDSDEIDELEDMIKELDKKIEQLKKEELFGRSGKIVWEGTEKAVKASKGK